MTDSSKNKSRYQLKKNSMHNGSYKGNSPFFVNIPEYQFDKPLMYYPNIQLLIETCNFQIPRIRFDNRQKTSNYA